MKLWDITSLLTGATLAFGAFTNETVLAETIQQQKQKLLETMKEVHQLNPQEVTGLKRIFDNSPYLSQGNPEITQHPMTAKECQKRLELKKDKEFSDICGDLYMAPLYDPKTQKANQAKACIDQLEFPNIPCEYPVIWVRADEAASLCAAQGKRLCDAHEWEGGCAGQLLPPDYDYTLIGKMSAQEAVRLMRKKHNQKISPKKVWAYGPTRRNKVCGADSFKSPGCNGGNFAKCGSNTYPSGSFPECVSPLKVYDIHGNAAEHMNLPLKAEESASHPGTTYGHTEMKGSWFIFDKFKAHQDHCRWRAPYWHGSKVMDPKSHHNYHLGFRCCKTIP